MILTLVSEKKQTFYLMMKKFGVRKKVKQNQSASRGGAGLCSPPTQPGFSIAGQWGFQPAALTGREAGDEGWGKPDNK